MGQPTFVYPQPSVLPGALDVPQPVLAAPMAAQGVLPMSPYAAGPGQPVAPGETLPPPAGVVAPPGVAPGSPAEMASLGPNPISVPVTNEDVAWDQIADVVSDYFTISREQRARRNGEVWTEGRIETAPQDGATWLQPFRRDSVGSFNRWESTFQTIRRRAIVRVIPEGSGYQVEVVVEKELEDLPTPEMATAGAAVFTGDESLPTQRLEQKGRVPVSPRWLSLGRDPALEQRMLGDIQARLGGVAARPAIVAP
jgi:hypothetical protein